MSLFWLRFFLNNLSIRTQRPLRLSIRLHYNTPSSVQITFFQA